MAFNLQTYLTEEINRMQKHHWKHQWASDMVREEDEDSAGEDDYSFRNDWDEWFWSASDWTLP